ncbi:hypothetical protein PM082_024793 [Marasmius tenuissimus]|nr:hypothetical protein PM082_024793 [Marasmius tenuissimus]
MATCSAVLKTSLILLRLRALIESQTSPHVLPLGPLNIQIKEQLGPQKLRVDNDASIPNISIMSGLNLSVQTMTITSNLISDIILLWRCYKIWVNRRRILLIPALLCLANNAIGYLAVFITHAAYGVVAFEGSLKLFTGDKLQIQSILLLCFLYGSLLGSLFLTALIAGGILNISRKIKSNVFKGPITRMYRTIIHASLESGVLYLMALFAYTVLLLVTWYHYRQALPSSSVLVGLKLGVTVLYSSLIPIMGIASTMIIVRTALGIAVNDEQSFRVVVLGEGSGRRVELRG